MTPRNRKSAETIPASSPHEPRSIFEPQMEILPPEQKAIWPGLQAVACDGFVLYGGTAIALRLGHRISVDFDFFTHEQVDLDWVMGRYPFCESATVIQAAPNTLTVLVPGETGSVKISFFGGVSNGRVGKPSWTSDGALQVASLMDLLGTKLKTIQQRVEKKDYIDIYAILSSGIKLEDGLVTAQALYGRTFQVLTALRALGYHKDGNLPEMEDRVKAFLVGVASETRELPPLPKVYPSLRGEE